MACKPDALSGNDFHSQKDAFHHLLRQEKSHPPLLNDRQGDYSLFGIKNRTRGQFWSQSHWNGKPQQTIRRQAVSCLTGEFPEKPGILPRYIAVHLRPGA